jgi:hypothetical protein
MVSFKAVAVCLGVIIGLAGSALAQSQGSSSSTGMQTMGGMKDMKKGSGMSGMSMDQQMAYCADMRGQMKQGKPMTPEMQQQMKACDDMDKQMKMPSATKSR